MNTPTASSGLVRFASQTKPEPDLNDPDQALRHVTGHGSDTRWALRALRDLPERVLPEVLCALWSRQPDLLREIAINRPSPELVGALESMMSADSPDDSSPKSLGDLFEGASDATFDRVLVEAWALHDALQEQLLDRLRRLPEHPRSARSVQARASYSASRFAGRHDVDLLVALTKKGRVKRKHAQQAAREFGVPVHRLVPTPVTASGLHMLLDTLLYRHGPRPVPDSDVDFIVEHAELLKGYYSPSAAQMTTAQPDALLNYDQRMALLKTGHIALAAVVGCVLQNGPRSERISDDEQALLRDAVLGHDGRHDGYRVGRALADRAPQALGTRWLQDRVSSAVTGAEMAMWFEGKESSLRPRLYVTIGRCLNGSLTQWLASRHDDAAVQLAAEIGTHRLLERLNGLEDWPRLCVVLAGLPAALAAAPAPPPWAGTLVTGALGDTKETLGAAEDVLRDGFKGSFLDLRAEVVDETDEGPFESTHWFRQLAHNMRH